MRRSFVTAVALAGLALLGGCPAEPSPAGPRAVAELASLEDAAGKAKIAAAVDAAFGTPLDPRAPASAGLDTGRVAKGRVSYVGLCLHCHGSSCDGAGPASVGMDPLPRDFRYGLFKFTSTGPGSKPSRADLAATLRRGIALAKMPSFTGLEPEKIDALVEWVVWVAMRGESEKRLAAAWNADGELDAEQIKNAIEAVVTSWPKDGAAAPVAPGASMPDATAAVIARGAKLFHDASVKCNSCHGETGKGDGSSGQGLKDDWGRPLAPRDLTLGIYRNGSRPVDLYRTIASGVKGTPMPAFANTLPAEDIWALVWYVKSLGAAQSPVW